MRCAKNILRLGILGLGVLGPASPHALAQSPSILMRRGDPIIGVGALDKIDNIRIIDSRTWIAAVESDVRDNDINNCLLRSGFLAMRENMPIPDPVGGILRGNPPFGSMGVTPRGDIAIQLRARVDGTNGDGVFWNFRKLAYKGDVADFPGLPAGTIWDRVEVVRTSGFDTVLVLAELDNPQLTQREDSLIRFKVDAQGNVIEKTLLATEGQLNDLLGTIYETLGTSTLPEHSLDANVHGDFVLPVNGLGRRVMMKNLDTILAEDLTPSPVPGRRWNANAFTLSKVSINDRGDIAFSGNLEPIGGDPNADQTNFLIVRNNEKFAQSGDVIPTLSTNALQKATPTIALTNAGDLFWRAGVLNGNLAAFMRNYQPLVQETTTVISGSLVTTIAGGDNCFTVSPEGRFFVGRVELQGIGSTLVFIDFGLVRERHGCLGVNSGSFRRLSGEPRLGRPIELGMTDGPAAGSLPIVVFSRNPLLSPNGCGAPTPFGELMLRAPITHTIFLAPWDGVNPSVLGITIPNNIALIDAIFYAQGVFRSTTQPFEYRLTNALQIEVGPP